MKLEQYVKLYGDVKLRLSMYFWTYIHMPNIDEEAMDMMQDVVLHPNFDHDDDVVENICIWYIYVKEIYAIAIGYYTSFS